MLHSDNDSSTRSTHNININNTNTRSVREFRPTVGEMLDWEQRMANIQQERADQYSTNNNCYLPEAGRPNSNLERMYGPPPPYEP